MSMDKQKLSAINSCIAGIKKRDENSVNMLYDLIASVIGYIAYKYLKDVDTEDLIQDFWASIYDLADKFILMTNGYGYLCKTMNRMAINRRKKLYGDNVKTIHYVDYSRLKYSDDNRSIEEINFKMNVEKAMEKLDDTERLIMQLTIFEDKTIVQIAHELKLSKSQVGRKQLEAKQKLKKEFCEFLGKNHE